MQEVSTKKPFVMVLGKAEAGQRVQVQLNEWGQLGKHGQKAELLADGQVDTFLTDLAAQPTDQRLLTLSDRRLARFAAQAIETAKRYDLEPKTGYHWRFCREERHGQLKKALAQVELQGAVYQVSDKADATRMGAYLYPDNSYPSQKEFTHHQRVVVSYGREGNRVEIYTWPKESKTHHVIGAPMREDNSIDLSRLEERLEIRPDWFGSSEVQGWPEQCIRTIRDPRLKQLTEKADLAQPVGADLLGPGWKFSESKGVQRFERPEQVIEFDPRSSQVLFMCTKNGKPLWPLSGVLYQNGKFSYVPHHRLDAPR